MNTYEIISNQIISELEKGIVPWQKPWTGGLSGSVSYNTGRPYSFLNQMLLGFRGGEYLTFNQVRKLGGSVKKGAKSGMVVFYSMIEKKERDADGVEHKTTFPYLTTSRVFNLEDTTGIKARWTKELKGNTDNDFFEIAENAINAYIDREDGLTCVHENIDRAFYSPSTDSVTVPTLQQFVSSNEYYGTTFHELVHSTLTATRCNRPSQKFGKFGDEVYSKEELVAEIGSAMILKELGIDTEKCFKNSVSYIGSWLKVLKNDNRFIVEAAKYAEQAVKLILTGERPNKKR